MVTVVMQHGMVVGRVSRSGMELDLRRELKSKLVFLNTRGACRLGGARCTYFLAPRGASTAWRRSSSLPAGRSTRWTPGSSRTPDHRNPETICSMTASSWACSQMRMPGGVAGARRRRAVLDVLEGEVEARRSTCRAAEAA